MPVGKRIYLKRNLPDPAVVAGLGEIPASNISDCMERDSAMNPRIHLVSSPKREITAGPALTVKCRAGDNLTLHMAMEIASEGDVVVVSNEEDDTRAIMGEIIFSYLFYGKKVAAIIVDGPIRDSSEVKSWPWPIYCTGTTPGGPYKEGPGEVNVPISCGGISVNPGDVIVCDADGVIVIPRKDAPEILEAAIAFQKQDAAKAAKAKLSAEPRAWVADAIAKKGYEVIDGVYEP